MARARLLIQNTDYFPAVRESRYEKDPVTGKRVRVEHETVPSREEVTVHVESEYGVDLKLPDGSVFMLKALGNGRGFEINAKCHSSSSGLSASVVVIPHSSNVVHVFAIPLGEDPK